MACILIYEAFLSFENISENIILRKIILKIDKDTRKKKDVREIVTLAKSEVFFQLWQEKKFLRTNFGLSFVIAMHRE